MNDSVHNPSIDAQAISAPLFDGKIWLKILGFSYILQGVFFAISIVGLIVAWIPLWIGVKCLKAAGAVERAYSGNDADGLLETNRHLKTAITIMGVLQLLLAIVYVGALLIGMTMPMFIASMGGHP